MGRRQFFLRRVVSCVTAVALAVGGVLVGAAPAQALTTGTLVPPSYLTLRMLSQSNTIGIPFTSNATAGTPLYLTVTDIGPGPSSYSKTISAISGSGGSGSFDLMLDAPSDVAEGDVFYFSVSDSTDPQVFPFATASRRIVAPGAITVSKANFFAGSWGTGVQVAGTGFPHSARVTVSVVTGNDSMPASNFIPPTSLTTNSDGTFALAIPQVTLAASGPPQLPGGAHAYYRVAAVDSLGNSSTGVNLNVLSVAPGTGLSPAVAVPGDVIAVTATGLQPNERVEVWVHSVPTMLLTGIATGAGTFGGTVTLPALLDIGSHLLEIRGPISGSQWLALGVAAPSVAPVAAPVNAPVTVSTAPLADGSGGMTLAPPARKTPSWGRPATAEDAALGAVTATTADTVTTPDIVVNDSTPDGVVEDAAVFIREGGTAQHGAERDSTARDSAAWNGVAQSANPNRVVMAVLGTSLVLIVPLIILGQHALRRHRTKAED